MRRTVIGLAAAAVFVFAACGGDDDSSGDDAGSGSEAAGANASPSSPEAERFCNEFLELTQSGPTGSGPDAVVEAMRGLHPPEDIAADFELTVEGTELQAQMAEGGGQPDPELQEQFNSRQQDYQQANMRIQEFLATECGLGAPPAEGGSGESGGSGGSTGSGGSGG